MLLSIILNLGVAIASQSHPQIVVFGGSELGDLKGFTLALAQEWKPSRLLTKAGRVQVLGTGSDGVPTLLGPNGGRIKIFCYDSSQENPSDRGLPFAEARPKYPERYFDMDLSPWKGILMMSHNSKPVGESSIPRYTGTLDLTSGSDRLYVSLSFQEEVSLDGWLRVVSMIRTIRFVSEKL